MITIKEIAKRADVSPGTVDRVLHNRGRVAPEKEKRIRQIIKELNYTPNVFAKTLKLGRTFQFGILMPFEDQDSEYWRLPALGINEASKELQPQKIDTRFFYYDKYSETSFESIAKEAINADLDGLLIAPVLYQQVDDFLEKIPPDLPYVFFDSSVPNANCLTCIGQDSHQSGVLSAKLLRSLVPPNSQIAAIHCLPQDFHIEQRIMGFLSYIDKKDDINVTVYDIHGSDVDHGYERLVQGILDNHSDLAGIFVSNSLTFKVAQVVQKNALEKNIKIIGYDLIPPNVDYLKSGVIDYLISQTPKMQGYRGIHSLYRHVVLGEKVASQIMMPIDILTRENIDYYQG